MLGAVKQTEVMSFFLSLYLVLSFSIVYHKHMHVFHKAESSNRESERGSLCIVALTVHKHANTPLTFPINLPALTLIVIPHCMY